VNGENRELEESFAAMASTEAIMARDMTRFEAEREMVPAVTRAAEAERREPLGCNCSRGAGVSPARGRSRRQGSQLPRGEDHAPSGCLRRSSRWPMGAEGSRRADEL
jgi:hypothetical protein